MNQRVAFLLNQDKTNKKNMDKIKIEAIDIFIKKI